MTAFKRSSNKSQETRKIKKILHEEIRLGIYAGSDSEPEEVDLKKELFPLGHYINDREEMIEQMFSIIKADKLKKMLPPILKDIPLDEIKADCLIHLLGMSTKRIMATLEGREVYSSSDSETNSGSSTSPNKKTKLELKPFMIKQEGCSDISDNSEEVVLVEPDGESSRSAKGNEKHKKKHKHKKKNIQKSKSNRGKIHKEKVKQPQSMTNQLHESSTGSENEDGEDNPKKEKSLLDMLELEMRRRAIRALLDKEGNPEHEGKDNSLEKPTHSTDTFSENTKNTDKTHSESTKVTPVKNFRKKKRKNDDVIVIVPKLVTIDLTAENQQNKTDLNKVVNEQHNTEVENLINSIHINTDEEKGQLNVNNHNTDTSEECSNTSDVEVEGSKIESLVNDDVIDIPDSPEPSEIQGNTNTEKEKPNHDVVLGGKEEQSNSNWALRWLDSKDVKKVVSTSKLCGNIRKKIKSAKLAKKSQEDLPKDAVIETPEIHGSVVEYQSLPKSSSTLNSITKISTGKSTEDNKPSQCDQMEETQVAMDLKQLALVVEQVQDVTSTKNEISVSTVTNDQIVANVQVNESSGYLNKEQEGDLQEINLLESGDRQVNISESNVIDATYSQSSLLQYVAPEQTNYSELLPLSQEENKCDGNPKNVSSSNDNVGLGVDVNLRTEPVESEEAESTNKVTIAPPLKEFEDSIQTNSYQESTNSVTDVPDSKDFENSSKIKPCQHHESPHDNSDNFKSDNNTEQELEPTSDLDQANYTLKTKTIINQDISSRKSSVNESSDRSVEDMSSAELLSEAQETGNEPEALEIDITEEDREIE